jgi:4-hydroxybenzoate polyprenyltransferase
MLFPLIPPRLHGWLDDLVVLVYLAGALLLHLSGAAAALAFGGAAFHCLLTRFTDYPQGTWKRIPFRTHAVIELGEGLLVLAGTAALATAAPLPGRLFLFGMGLSQLVAFGFSDYGPRLPDRPAGK